MKIKVGDTTYDPNETPLMVILSDADKANIANMPREATKYCVFPDTMNEEEIDRWMADTEDTKVNHAIPESEIAPSGGLPTSELFDVDLALELAACVHSKCSNVPHDIGITLAQIVARRQCASSWCDCDYQSRKRLYALGAEYEKGGSVRMDRSLDRIVGHFNDAFQCDYTADDLRWDLHNGDKAAVAFVRGWEQAMIAVRSVLPHEAFLDDPTAAEMKGILRWVKNT
jgi:hypothetical protein